MIEKFTDEQRVLLKELVLREQLARPNAVLLEIFSRLNGTDTVIYADRALPSHRVREERFVREPPRPPASVPLKKGT